MRRSFDFTTPAGAGWRKARPRATAPEGTSRWSRPPPSGLAA